MKDEEIKNLLGGFATDTLTPQERELLFTAALKDQELFDALADDQVLRDFLSDPISRQKVLRLLQPEEKTHWMRRPLVWAIASGLMAAMIAIVVIRQPHPPQAQMAKAVPASAPTAVAEPAPQPTEARRDAAPAIKREAPSKMKVAVLDFDSGPAQVSADLGKTTSDLLGKKLDSSGYEVVDRKEVDKALQDQKLNERQLAPAEAASVGRSVGADAVIVGSVKPRLMSGFRQAPPTAAPAPAPQKATENVEVTAQVIDTANANRLGFAQNAATLTRAVDQVAVSLKQQMQQNAQIRIEGLVTDVNAKILTLNVGAKAGVKPGDRLEVRRGNQALGHVGITSSQDTFSVGVFDGPEPARIGDAVVNQ